MTEGLRIVVTGLAATYPLGGVFWDYMHFVLGFHRLGHDVLYLEDPGYWGYDPGSGTFVESGERSAAYLARHIERLEPELARRWFYRDATGNTFGRDWQDVVRFCRTADLFLHVSASCWMREEYFAARRLAFFDTDPMLTQASLPGYLAGTLDGEMRDRVRTLLRHDVFFTVGLNVGAPDCRIPTGPIHWIPTCHPMVLERLREAHVRPSSRRGVLTTVGSWRHAEDMGDDGKSVEFEGFLGVAANSPLPLELALSGAVPRNRLRAAGWRLRDGYEVSADPWMYRDYLARSTGEWSVAKRAYVAGRTGWFSGRTACYLTLGVPAVVQETGFSKYLPTGEGLFAFESPEEAVRGMRRIAESPERHARAALGVAREYFDSKKVLPRLLEDAFRCSGAAGGAG
jgi:hypothetical protein